MPALLRWSMDKLHLKLYKSEPKYLLAEPVDVVTDLLCLPSLSQGAKARDAGSDSRLSLALLPALDDWADMEGPQGHHLSR